MSRTNWWQGSPGPGYIFGSFFLVNLEEFVLCLSLNTGSSVQRREKKIRDLATILCEFLISFFGHEDSEFVRELAPTVMNYAWYAFTLIKLILGSDR